VITVNVQDRTVKSPVAVEMTDSSGAHVELTLLLGNLPPIRHAFAFTEGTISVPLPGLKPGKYSCTFFIQVLKHKVTPNRMYDAVLTVNGGEAASAKGNIPKDRTNDIGFGDFELTVKP
jgi:hypothetical protein